MRPEGFSAKAKIEKNGTIWLPLPASLNSEIGTTWGGMLLLASHSKCQIGIARDGEIVVRKGFLVDKGHKKEWGPAGARPESIDSTSLRGPRRPKP